jgi:putative ABC transport system permease protein
LVSRAATFSSVLIWEIGRAAVRALVRRKAQTFLAVLGIVIGIAAVILTVAIGDGAAVRLADSFRSMGVNLLVLRPGSSPFGGVQGGFGSRATITVEDLAAIRELSRVRRVSPRPMASFQLVSEGSNWKTDVNGVIPDFFEIRVWRILRGRNISAADVEEGAKVMVLGLTVAEKLFGPQRDPVGETVRLGNIDFVVIGLLEHKGMTSGGWDLDDNAYMPFTTYVDKVQGGSRRFVNGTTYISAISAEEASRAVAQITELLRDRHHLAPGVDDDFQIRNNVAQAQAEAASARTMANLLAAVAAVSLVVAGVSIMNIMLVSVTERTREIGLRVAVGAKPRDILLQFVAEALALALVGGSAGTLLGIGMTGFIGGLFGWPVLVRVDGALLAIAVSAAVGLLFGVYPAMSAAALDPIEALRFES